MVAVALSWGFTLGAVGSQGGAVGKGGTWSENARGPGRGEALEKETRLAAERPVRGTAQWSSGDDKGRATLWHGSGVRGLGGTCSLVGQSSGQGRSHWALVGVRSLDSCPPNAGRQRLTTGVRAKAPPGAGSPECMGVT